MRTVRVHASLDRSKAELEFAYDAEIVQVVRSLRQRRWHPGAQAVDRGEVGAGAARRGTDSHRRHG
jgi:hypothetical protein